MVRWFAVESDLWSAGSRIDFAVKIPSISVISQNLKVSAVALACPGIAQNY
jgi:hypothetical protein